LRKFEFGGLDWSTVLEHWTTGLDHWNGSLDYSPGKDSYLSQEQEAGTIQTS